jgi:tetratricopeptide (TPR) repeat protein
VTRTFGPYRVLAELGSGGMGTVYRAETEAGDTVALKVIHAHLVGKSSFKERFGREVEIGRRVRHDNVVATLGAGEADGSAYIAMELVDGQTLRELLDEIGTLPEELCSHIGREVACALQAIHEAGAFHRDIKPENVLITAENRVKVMDLGVALLADESLRLSQSGVFVGSVLYAAPEQFQRRTLDGRADLYMLGLLLYELATGVHPFQSDDMATIIQRQISELPQPPSALNPQLSPFFEEVVLNLVAKDRDERIPDAAELRAVLEQEERSAWWLARARALHGPLRRIRIPRETSQQGREHELAQLDRLYRRVCRGEGQVCLIEGEAGIGKTRLVDEFVGQLAREGEEFHFLIGSYPPGGAATAAGALSTAYREFFGSAELAERLPEYFEATPGLVPAFAALLSGEPPPAGVEPLSRQSLLLGFGMTTKGLAAERPTIVVIEDLHFAPELGLAIFASLAASLGQQRVLLIGTARPGLPERWTFNLSRFDHATRVPMQRLTPKELSRLLVELFRSEGLADELGWAIATKSDGNPFFVFELVRSLREDKLIERSPGGRWVKTGVIRDISVPSSVIELVAARIDDLEEIDKDLLEVASCCGFEFDPLLVAAALEIDQIPAMKRFAHLERKHRLVRGVGRRYVFDHHQVQEALYRGLPQLLREPYHARLGVALEARAGEADGAATVELSEHFLAGGDAERVAKYLPRALRHLVDGYLHDEAIALAARALEAEGLLTGARRVEVLLQNAASLELRGRHDEDRAALEEALELADAEGDARLRAQVRIQMGRLGFWTADLESAREWLDAALELAREAGDDPTEGAALGNLGIVHYRQREFDRAQPLFERAFEKSRARGDKRGMAVGTLNLGNVFWCRGQFDEAKAHYERYQDLSREIGYREGEALAAGNLGNVLFSLGRVAEASSSYKHCLALAEAIGDRHKTALFTASLANVDMLLGRFKRAHELLERARALSREIGMRREEAAATRVLGEIAVEKGDFDGARELLEESVRVFDEIGEGEGALTTRVALGRLAWIVGREEDAVRELDAALAEARTIGDRSQELTALALRACLPGGDAKEAARLLDELRPTLAVYTRMNVAYFLFRATGEQGFLAEARESLERLRDSAPEEDRVSLCEGHRAHREMLGGAGAAPAGER